VAQLAYLVIREGSKWTDVFRLVPGEAVTIGRAPDNGIVIKDERCSRSHAEVFLSEDRWTLRDLHSRNGTMVSGELVKEDWALRPGDVIRIGRSQLVFVHHLTEAFSDSSTVIRRSDGADASHPEDGKPRNASSALAAYQPTTITHRRGQTKFLEPGKEEESGVSKIGQAAAKLCRLAFELAKAPDAQAMADLALSGLFEGTHTDTGALLIVSRGPQQWPHDPELEVVASRSTAKQRYHQVSPFLATTVMSEGEAVLARNIMGDSTLGPRDSKGEIHATSVICAPRAGPDPHLFH